MNSEDINYRKLTINTFKEKEIDRIVWQPRIYYWFYGSGLKNKTPEGYDDDSTLQWMRKHIDSINKPSVPKKYKERTMLEIYDMLNASPRYPEEVLGVPIFKQSSTSTGFGDSKKVNVNTHYDEKTNEVTTIYKTPKGSLRKVESGYVKEYPVKEVEDIEIMQYVLKHADFEFDEKAFKVAKREFGKRGPVQSYFVRSPLQSLIVDYLGFEKTILYLNRHREKIEDLLNVIDEWHDTVWDIVLDSPVKILNFGENIDHHFDSPPLFEEYLLPYYEKRIKQVHQNNKYCYIHVDGSFKQLIELLRGTNFDGLEALTPKPQGDVTLEEMKKALGDKILLDGIPATLFTEQYSYEELEDFTKRVLDTFAPKLILGISDELPPTANIEKAQFVSDIVADYSI